MKKQRVTDVITTTIIKTWHNDIITICAGTGVGKSYFVKNILYAFAKANNKKILMLIHRSNCVSQFIREVERDKKQDVIHIRTYQSLESLQNNHKIEFDFKPYEYIVCDEFHYFISDASFNISTDTSLNLILQQTDKTRIFMSATGNYIKNYINNIKRITTKDYELPITYDHINQLNFFTQDETIENLLKESIDKNLKAIFFIQSAKKAYELYSKYKKHCLFNCSKSNNNFYKYVDTNKINQMLKNEKFEELILITTVALDAGVNIVDINLKNIIVDVVDVTSLIQCIGRKRQQDHKDKSNLFIKVINNKKLGGLITQLNKKIDMAEYFKTHTVKQYVEKYFKQYDKTCMVYDDTVAEDNKSTKKINELMYFKCKLDILDIEKMLDLGEYGYCKYLARLFGFYRNEKYYYNLLEEEIKKESLEEYLESIIGKKLYKEDQQELIGIIGLKDLRGRIQKSINQFNSYFVANNIKVILVSERKSERIKDKIKKDSYWILYKMVLNVDENVE